jgi:transcriptional regulator of acetoin/glycerol metabolism
LESKERTKKRRPRREWQPLIRQLIARYADAEVTTLAESERAHILRALRATRGSATQAAAKLGVAYGTIYRRLEQYARELQQAEAR